MARWFIRVCGLLIVLRSLTNFAKLFQGDAAELVVFGQILRGADAGLPAVLVGLFMLATGAAMLAGHRWAFPLVSAYAVYVAVNLVTWTFTNPAELDRVGRLVGASGDAAAVRRTGGLAFLGYCIVALGTTALPAWLLARRRQ